MLSLKWTVAFNAVIFLLTEIHIFVLIAYFGVAGFLTASSIECNIGVERIVTKTAGLLRSLPLFEIFIKIIVADLSWVLNIEDTACQQTNTSSIHRKSLDNRMCVQREVFIQKVEFWIQDFLSLSCNPVIVWLVLKYCSAYLLKRF